MQLTLFQFPAAKEVPNYSPYCLKLETFFRVNNIPYQTKHTVNMNSSPKKSMPYIQLDGKLMSDTAFIIEHFKKQNSNWDLNRNLSSEQKAIATAFERLIEESINPIYVYFRWANAEGFQEFRELAFANAPAPVKFIFGGMLHRKNKKKSYERGIGRHSDQEIIAILKQNLQALSDFLGQKKYFFGDEISQLDMTAFGSLAQVFLARHPTLIVSNAHAFPNLQNYCNRMLELFNKKK